jgi:hypothetical protein
MRIGVYAYAKKYEDQLQVGQTPGTQLLLKVPKKMKIWRSKCRRYPLQRKQGAR